MDKAFTPYQKASERLKKGGFRLRKYETNEPKLAGKIKKSENEQLEIKQQEESE